MKYLVVILWLCVGAQIIEPTMQETVEWLTKNLPVKANYSGGDGEGETSFTVTEASITDCVCKLTTTHQISVKGGLLPPMVTRQRVSIPFASIAMEKIRLEISTVNTPHQISLWLSVAHDAKLITTEDIIRRRSEMRALTVLYFSDKPTAERFVKAFKRLATLCQQSSKEPF